MRGLLIHVVMRQDKHIFSQLFPFYCCLIVFKLQSFTGGIIPISIAPIFLLLKQVQLTKWKLLLENLLIITVAF